MRRAPVLVAVAVVMVCLSTGHAEREEGRPKSKKIYKRQKKAKPADPAEVTITSWQLCDGCQVAVQELGKAIAGEVDRLRRERTSVDTLLDGNAVVDALCDGAPIREYKEYVRWACMKLMQDHRVDILESIQGMVGGQEEWLQGRILDHKLALCTDKCRGGVGMLAAEGEATAARDRSRCSACKLTARALDARARRLRTASDEALVEVVEGVCETLNLDLRQAAWVQDTCFDMVDEATDALAGQLRLRLAMEAKGLHPSDDFPSKACNDVFPACAAGGHDEL